MRRAPRLRFVYDESLDQGMRIDAALRDVETERTAREAADPGGDEGDEAEDR
jgi:hypothetical protein